MLKGLVMRNMKVRNAMADVVESELVGVTTDQEFDDFIKTLALDLRDKGMTLEAAKSKHKKTILQLKKRRR